MCTFERNMYKTLSHRCPAEKVACFHDSTYKFHTSASIDVFEHETNPPQDDFVCAFGGDENEDAMAVTYVKTLGDVGLRTKFGYAEEAWENLQVNYRCSTV